MSAETGAVAKAARPEVGERWDAVFAWVEETVGGKIVEWRRQPRWRPQWFFDLRLPGGAVKKVVLRCQREEGMPWTKRLSVEREHRILLVLQEEGVRVAPTYPELSPEPVGILMDFVPGRDRFDERDDQETRDAVLLDYMEIVAAAQAIDPGRFVEIGLRRPESAEEIGRGGFHQTEKWYRQLGARPEPVNAFIIEWLHRNLPTDREKIVWNTWDAGQFLHDGGRCTALMDVEFSMLGDPLNDLAAMRWRDANQPIGDLTKAYAHYAELTGEELDRRVINYQAVRFAAVTAPLSIAERLDPRPEFDHAQWEAWAILANLVGLEIIAEELGIELGSEEQPVQADPSRRQSWLLSSTRVLDQVIGEVDDEFTRYRLEGARADAASALRADELGLELEARDREDEKRLLGRPASDWLEAERLLEEYVLAAGPEEDAKLVQFLYRRLRRHELMYEPAMRMAASWGWKLQPIDWDALAAR
ncbi:MAG: phosphotransferase [Actinobacteria bacterium]|nr:phosphotransferase [Actinomycetota bacterium]